MNILIIFQMLIDMNRVFAIEFTKFQISLPVEAEAKTENGHKNVNNTKMAITLEPCRIF